MVQIKSYPAKNGDAFMVRSAAPSLAVLVDAGYVDTYRNYIRSDLARLAEAGSSLDVVVATHIDADHISGLISFFRENGSAAKPIVIPVKRVLHNSLRSLLPNSRPIGEYSASDKALLKELRHIGFPIRASVDAEGLEISALQGSTLADLLLKSGYFWNEGQGRSVVGQDGIIEVQLGSAELQILTPNSKRLDSLKSSWVSAVRRIGLIGSLEGLDDIFEIQIVRQSAAAEPKEISSTVEDLARAFTPDTSVTNGSSITFILRIGNSRLLFLADAWADETIQALGSKKTIFDAIKVSHHGSVTNTNCELLDLIDSPHFFVSTNGEGHGHPSFAVLKAIFDRPSKFTRTIHFNYSTPASRRLKEYVASNDINAFVDEDQTGWVTIEGGFSNA